MGSSRGIVMLMFALYRVDILRVSFFPITCY